MAFIIPNPELWMIKRRSRILEKLIKQYPDLVKASEKDMIKTIEEYASQESYGDKELEALICSDMYAAALADDEELKNLFYQSMLLMIVSYYESVVSMFAKTANTRELINAICKSKNIQLSEEIMTDIGLINEEVNTLRNNVCHNGFGTPRKTDLLRKIANENDDIQFKDDVISITGPNYILNILNMESKILLELSDKLGYKDKIYKDGKVAAVKYKKENL